MAAKAHLRNGRPLILAVSTNDGLGASAPNLGSLLGRKQVYFVPFGQDDWAYYSLFSAGLQGGKSSGRDPGQLIFALRLGASRGGFPPGKGVSKLC